MPPHHCALLTEKVISPVQNQHQNSWHTNLGRTIDSAHVPPRLRSKSDILSRNTMGSYRELLNDGCFSRFTLSNAVINRGRTPPAVVRQRFRYLTPSD